MTRSRSLKIAIKVEEENSIKSYLQKVPGSPVLDHAIQRPLHYEKFPKKPRRYQHLRALCRSKELAVAAACCYHTEAGL